MLIFNKIQTSSKPPGFLITSIHSVASSKINIYRMKYKVFMAEDDPYLYNCSFRNQTEINFVRKMFGVRETIRTLSSGAPMLRKHILRDTNTSSVRSTHRSTPFVGRVRYIIMRPPQFISNTLITHKRGAQGM
jgi:hypothetical protein